MTSIAISADPILSATDYVAITVAVVLSINALMRIFCGSPNRALLWGNLAMVATLVLSISVVYKTLDPLLGGSSYLNLVTHLFMIGVGWAITRSTEDTLSRLSSRSGHPVLLGSWVPLVGVVGTTVSFLVLDPESSRGLEDYGQEPAYVAYWLFTMFPLLLAAFPLMPRLAQALGAAREVPSTVTLSLLMLLCSYMGVIICLIFFVLTALAVEFYLFREIVVAMTLMAFTGAFTTASITQLTGRGRSAQPTLR